MSFFSLIGVRKYPLWLFTNVWDTCRIWVVFVCQFVMSINTRGFYFEGVCRKLGCLLCLTWPCFLREGAHSAFFTVRSFRCGRCVRAENWCGRSFGGRGCPAGGGTRVPDNRRSPRRSMGLTERLIGLLWFRCALLCAGEKHRCLYNPGEIKWRHLRMRITRCC